MVNSKCLPTATSQIPQASTSFFAMYSSGTQLDSIITLFPQIPGLINHGTIKTMKCTGISNRYINYVDSTFRAP